jgi:hypothetical protein
VAAPAESPTPLVSILPANRQFRTKTEAKGKKALDFIQLALTVGSAVLPLKGPKSIFGIPKHTFFLE